MFIVLCLVNDQLLNFCCPRLLFIVLYNILAFEYHWVPFFCLEKNISYYIHINYTKNKIKIIYLGRDIKNYKKTAIQRV